MLRPFALALVLAAGPTAAQVGPPYFDAPWRAFQTAAADGDGNYALDITTADLNGDGLADAVVGQSFAAPGLRVMLNAGAAGAAPAVLQEGGTLYPMLRGAPKVVVADLDGDGDPDLAAPDNDLNTLGSNFVVLRNRGDGTFAPPQSASAGARATHLAAADLDGDGDTDLAFVGYRTSGAGGPVVTVVRNAGNATFGAPVAFALSAEGFTGGVEAGDLDGDGDADLAVAHVAEASRISLFLNTGAATFSAPQVFSPFEGNTVPSELALLDPDGDGDLDVLHPGFYDGFTSQGHLVLLRNRGAAGFAAETFLYANGGNNIAFELTAADLDGDGRDDAVGAQPFEAGFIIFRDNDAGGFLPGEMYASVARSGESSGTIATAAGDLDGDGDLDVLTTGRLRRLVAVHENLGDGRFPERSLSGHAINHQVIDLGDIDGDGDLDAATSHGGASSANVLVFRNDGTGLFTQSHLAAGGGAFAKLRDLDGDGVLDLLWVSAPASPPYDFFTARGMGNGAFAPAIRHPLGTCGSGHPSAVDLDADGDLDVVNTENGACMNVPASGRRLFISLNQGNGTFAPATTTPAGSFPYNTAAGDFDEDGLLDLVTASQGASAIVFGNGDGTFRGQMPLPAGRLGANILALDLNADGHLDLATLDEFSPDGSAGDESLLTVLLGSGTGTFVETEHSEHPTQSYRDWVTVGDVDADGDPDLIAGGVQDVIVFTNDGAGVFAYAGRYGIGTDAYAPHYADLTGDGRGDLIALVAYETPPAGLDNGLVVVAGRAGAPVADAPVPVAPGGVALGLPSPNPTTSQVAFVLTLAVPQHVRAEAFDMLGRRVSLVHDGPLDAGAHGLSLDGTCLPDGAYAVRVVGADGARATRRFVVAR